MHSNEQRNQNSEKHEQVGYPREHKRKLNINRNIVGFQEFICWTPLFCNNKTYCFGI